MVTAGKRQVLYNEFAPQGRGLVQHRPAAKPRVFL
jgi:hypothetical protein